LETYPPPPKQPQTPKITLIFTDSAVKTLQKSCNILRAINNVRGYVSPINRTVRSVLRKVGKALDQSNVKIALLEAENVRLKEDLRATEPRSRKKVKEPLNSKFARIGNIVTAKEASQKPLKRRRVTARVNPTPAMEEAQEVIYHGLESLRRAEEM